MNSFAGMFISGAQRLPNGNTLICSGPTGHLFEVTADKQVVWEYINPHSLMGISTTQTDAQANMAMTFRSFRYGADYAGLAGKDLTSMGTITGEPAFGEDVPASVVYTGWGAASLSGEGGGGDAGGGGGGGGGGY